MEIRTLYGYSEFDEIIQYEYSHSSTVLVQYINPWVVGVQIWDEESQTANRDFLCKETSKQTNKRASHNQNKQPLPATQPYKCTRTLPYQATFQPHNHEPPTRNPVISRICDENAVIACVLLENWVGRWILSRDETGQNKRGSMHPGSNRVRGMWCKVWYVLVLSLLYVINRVIHENIVAKLRATAGRFCFVEFGLHSRPTIPDRTEPDTPLNRKKSLPCLILHSIKPVEPEYGHFGFVEGVVKCCPLFL